MIWYNKKIFYNYYVDWATDDPCRLRSKSLYLTEHNMNYDEYINNIFRRIIASPTRSGYAPYHFELAIKSVWVLWRPHWIKVLDYLMLQSSLALVSISVVYNCLLLLMEHPFNLKGGAMVFFGVKIFFFDSQRSRIFFSRTLLLFYKNNIF